MLQDTMLSRELVEMMEMVMMLAVSLEGIYWPCLTREEGDIIQL